MKSLIEHGFDVRLVSVSTDGLGEEWLENKINPQSLEELSVISREFRFNLDGEGGEFETIVLDAPHMAKKDKEVLVIQTGKEIEELGF